jgi:hypothetical protein
VLALDEHGTGRLAATEPDRFVMGHLWAPLAPSAATFWAAALVAQAVLWPLLALCSALLWRRLRPGLARDAPLVACVTVAPYLTKVQAVTANIALASLLSVVAAYAAGLCALRFVDRGRAPGVIACSPLLLLAVLLQEYAIAVVGVMLVVLSLRARFATDPAMPRRAALAMLACSVVAGLGYVAYAMLGDLAARPEVLPVHPLTLGAGYFAWMPLQLVLAAWRALGGAVAAELARLDLASLAGLCAGAYGALVGALLFTGCRGERARASRTPAEPGFTWLAAALALGLLPVVVMGRMPWDPGDGMSSRFGIPVLPVVASVVVLAVTTVVRPRFVAVPIVLLGFAAGHAAITDAWEATRDRAETARLGDALLPRVARDGGYTAAVVALPERALGPRRQWELTARLAANWPPELRAKLWAYRFGGGPDLHYREDAVRVFGDRATCQTPRTIEAGIRIVTRTGPLARLLWVEPRPDGSVTIEDYCRRPGEPASHARREP